MSIFVTQSRRHCALKSDVPSANRLLFFNAGEVWQCRDYTLFDSTTTLRAYEIYEDARIGRVKCE